MIVRIGLTIGIACLIAACGHREVKAPCGPLAFASESRLLPASHPLRAFDRDAECGEARPVNGDQSSGVPRP